MITIYHNPRCGKSRNCVAFLETSNKEFEIIKYLETPLSFSMLEDIIKKLNLKPIDLIRKNEIIWKENFKDTLLTDKEIIQSMVDYPILIERPIAVYKNKAVIARPLEKINEII